MADRVPLEQWFKDKPEMLAWAQRYLKSKRAPFPETQPPYNGLLQGLQRLVQEGGSAAEKRLKDAWRRDKSSRRNVTVNISGGAKQHLAGLAKQANMTQKEALEMLITKGHGFRKELEDRLDKKYLGRAKRAAQGKGSIEWLHASQRQANETLMREIAQYLVLLEDNGLKGTPLTAEQRERASETYEKMASSPQERLSEFLATAAKEPSDTQPERPPAPVTPPDREEDQGAGHPRLGPTPDYAPKAPAPERQQDMTGSAEIDVDEGGTAGPPEDPPLPETDPAPDELAQPSTKDPVVDEPEKAPSTPCNDADHPPRQGGDNAEKPRDVTDLIERGAANRGGEN